MANTENTKEISRNKHSSCLVCESRKVQPLKNYYNEKGLLTCKVCDFVFMEQIPNLQELTDCYGTYSYTKIETVSEATVLSYNSLLDEFETYRKTNKILDVGTGRGWFLDEAKKRGWEVYGSEYSTTAVELCRARGHNMVEGILEFDKFEVKDFDVITSFEVIEHINNPHEDLNVIEKLLRPGGLFFCTTPNFNSLMRYYAKASYTVIDYPEHLSYYTRKTLKKVLEMHKFKTKKILTTGISLSRIEATKILDNADDIIVPKISTDEKLRTKLNSKWYLRLAKDIANRLLTITGTGMSLKGYFIKN